MYFWVSVSTHSGISIMIMQNRQGRPLVFRTSPDYLLIACFFTEPVTEWVEMIYSLQWCCTPFLPFLSLIDGICWQQDADWEVSQVEMCIHIFPQNDLIPSATSCHVAQMLQLHFINTYRILQSAWPGLTQKTNIIICNKEKCVCRTLSVCSDWSFTQDHVKFITVVCASLRVTFLP